MAVECSCGKNFEFEFGSYTIGVNEQNVDCLTGMMFKGPFFNTFLF